MNNKTRKLQSKRKSSFKINLCVIISLPSSPVFLHGYTSVYTFVLYFPEENNTHVITSKQYCHLLFTIVMRALFLKLDSGVWIKIHTSTHRQQIISIMLPNKVYARLLSACKLILAVIVVCDYRGGFLIRKWRSFKWAARNFGSGRIIPPHTHTHRTAAGFEQIDWR